MKRLFAGIALAATSALLVSAAPANAEVVYFSDGTTRILTQPVVDTTLVSPVIVEPMSTTRIITQPAVMQPVLTSPVHYNVLQQPAIIHDVDDDRNLFRLKLWPLLDFSLF